MLRLPPGGWSGPAHTAMSAARQAGRARLVLVLDSAQAVGAGCDGRGEDGPRVHRRADRAGRAARRRPGSTGRAHADDAGARRHRLSPRTSLGVLPGQRSQLRERVRRPDGAPRPPRHRRARTSRATASTTAPTTTRPAWPPCSRRAGDRPASARAPRRSVIFLLLSGGGDRHLRQRVLHAAAAGAARRASSPTSTSTASGGAGRPTRCRRRAASSRRWAHRRDGGAGARRTRPHRRGRPVARPQLFLRPRTRSGSPGAGCPACSSRAAGRTRTTTGRATRPSTIEAGVHRADRAAGGVDGPGDRGRARAAAVGRVGPASAAAGLSMRAARGAESCASSAKGARRPQAVAPDRSGAAAKVAIV